MSAESSPAPQAPFPAPDATALGSWVNAVDGHLCGIEKSSERLAERACAKLAASGPHMGLAAAVADLYGRVMDVACTLHATRRLLEGKSGASTGGDAAHPK